MSGITGDNDFLEPTSFTDPLADGSGCSRDVVYVNEFITYLRSSCLSLVSRYLQQLKVNTIRVYSVNSSLNHDSCMQTFSNAGIYIMCARSHLYSQDILRFSAHRIDLSLPVNGSITRESPAWSSNLLDLYLNTINAFSKYDNVLAYNVGNEIIISANGTGIPLFNHCIPW